MMKRIYRKLTLATSCLLTTLATSSSYADVYISYDSLQPTYDQKLSQAQLDSYREMTVAIHQQNDLNEFYAAEIINFQKEQQARTDVKQSNLEAQAFLNEQTRQANDRQANQIMMARASLEDQRLSNQSDAIVREAELLQMAVQQEQDFLEKQRALESQFFNTQAAVQRESLALQTSVHETQVQILENELRDGAPSNLIIVSADAQNMKQVIDPSQTDQITELGEAKQKSAVVNLNEFVSAILPPHWKYTAPDGLDNETINAVQGKDWQSILNHIAVNNPHLEITVSPKAQTVFVRNTMQYQVDSTVSRNSPYTTWHVSTSKSMRGNIEAFAKMAKWTVVWDTKKTDYDTVAPVVLKTRFAGKGGVVERLIRLTKDEDIPLHVEFKYGNKVAIITRKGAKTK